MVRIRHWYEAAGEESRWCLTGLMSRSSAEKIVSESKRLVKPSIVNDRGPW